MHHACFSSKPDIGFFCSEIDCSCKCSLCEEYKRVQSLPIVSEEELEEVSGMYMEATPGPWKATCLSGFGPMRFIVSENAGKLHQPNWFKIVAILENPGSFMGDKFIAWCRDGVPRLIKTIANLKQENAYLKSLLKNK